MPSTKDATLQSIQREISELIEREKELKENYVRSESENGVPLNNGSAHSQLRQPFERSKSTTSLLNGNSVTKNGTHLFTQNRTKGVMHRFIKSRGKVTQLSRTGIISESNVAPLAWTNFDLAEPPKPVIPPGMQPRNGFVPVEERIRNEFREMQMRETELRTEREKSQPDLLALLTNHSPEPERKALRSYSISQLSEFDAFDESMSAPSSLKAARSLADLCDVENEEIQHPGSHKLIKQWENLIQKNQQ